MKRYLLIIFALVMTFNMKAIAGDKDPYRYELVGTGLTTQSAGFIIVKVWNYGKKEKVVADQCLQSAIEGLLFKGYSKVGNDQGKKPLLPDGRDEYKDYLKKFISSGDYRQYIQLSNQGEPDEVIKLTGSKEFKYKVGMIVMVNYSALQKRLEKDGLTKSAQSVMDSMF